MDETVDAAWIRARLSGKRGEVARMAQALGIKQPDASKILSGKRNVQPNEFFPLLRFLGFTIIEPKSRPEAVEAIMRQVGDLSDDGLAFLQGQISALQKVPGLTRQPPEPQREP